MVRKLVESKDWGKRRLAYEINDFRDGYYQLMHVNAEPAAVEEFYSSSKNQRRYHSSYCN